MSSFYACRSRKRKKLLELTVFFILFGSFRVKAAHKHVDEIDPRMMTTKKQVFFVDYVMMSKVLTPFDVTDGDCSSSLQKKLLPVKK